MEKRLYSCDYVAQRYGVKVITVWDWIRKGKLEALRIGKMYRISEDQLEAFEQRGRAEGQA